MDRTANPSNHAPDSPASGGESLAIQVRRAVLWRSGSQILAQSIQWGATFLVIRILSPSDYGLFAMTAVVMAAMAMVNGYGLASGLVQRAAIDTRMIRQTFGMLIVLNVGIALLQVAIAPAVAAYYRQPQVAELLRVQAVLYLANPITALPYALLSRRMEFRLQARVNMAAAIAGGAAAVTGALAGLGVWTLVLAPLFLYFTRGIGMTLAARAWIRPSFDFAGAGHLARFGGLMALSQLFWFAQSQADVLIAGRSFSPHDLGLYTTALFLTQIFVAKFVPPLNEVAFSAYARIQHDPRATAAAFVKGVRIVFVAAMPFYIGLAVTAEPLVLTMLGDKWAEAVPIVRLLALAMPFMTLQVLFSPACDALGRPGIGVANGPTGAALLATAFLVGVHWGGIGLAVAWLAAYPLYLAVSSRRALPVIGARFGDVAAAIRPSLLAALVMAVAVLAIDPLVANAPPLPRLAALVALGAVTYAAALWTLARPLVAELVALIRR